MPEVPPSPPGPRQDPGASVEPREAARRSRVLQWTGLAVGALGLVDGWVSHAPLSLATLSRLALAATSLAVAHRWRLRPAPTRALWLVALGAAATIALVTFDGGARDGVTLGTLLFSLAGLLLLPTDPWLRAMTAMGDLLGGSIAFFALQGEQTAWRWAALSGVAGVVTAAFGRYQDLRAKAQAQLLRRHREDVLALGENLGRLQAIFDVSPDPISLVDATTFTYLLVNPAFCTLVGRPREQVLGHSAQSMGLFDVASLRGVLDARIEAGTTFAGDLRITRADQAVRLVHNVARPMVLDGQRVVLAYSRDVTESRAAEDARAQMQAELEQVHARLRLVIDNAPLVFFAVDEHGVITVTEGRGLSAVGSTPQRVVGQRYLDAYADEPDLLAAYEQGRQGVPLVTLARYLKYRQVWQTWWSPIVDRQGVARGVTGVSYEVTDRVAAEAAARASEASFRQLIEAVPDAVLVETAGRIVYTNEVAQRLLGYDHAGFAARGLADLFPERARAEARRRFDTLAQGQRTPPTRARLLGAQGQAPVVEGVAEHLRFNGVDSLLCIARDITERETMEARLRVADRMASVGTLAAGVAHEINNPLTYIIANLGLAKERLLTPVDPAARAELVEMLSEAQEGTSRVQSIVRDLKVFSRPDESAQELLDVHAAIETSVNMAWNQLRHRAKLERDYAADLPPVLGNRARLGQVVLNLLINAAQAVPEGQSRQHTITVRTRLDGDQRVRLQVIDDGVGIAPENLRRVFDPFFTTKEVGVGTGLGLSICLGIARSMGGELTLDSTLGQGTTVTLSVPAARLERSSGPSPSPTEPQPQGRQPIVWVVDDEPLVLKALVLGLSSDFAVKGFRDGRQVLEAFEQGEHFDALVCDVMMPELSGLALFERLARLEPRVGERVLFLTGGAFTPEAARFLADRAHLEKPIAAADLRRHVHQLLAAPPATVKPA